MRTSYADAHARQMVLEFREALGPLMTRVAPDWLLHNIELRRETNYDLGEQVVIRLVIRPIGSVRVVDDGADLNTGFNRLEGSTS
jgi:hypothetical protein